jgi:hypothetical protein
MGVCPSVTYKTHGFTIVLKQKINTNCNDSD